MTEHSEFSEICITLNAKEYSEIFTSEVADFTNEAIEFAESGAIIIRTSKDRKFIDALLAHLQGFCKDLSVINNQHITFSHTITKKQNRDWIEEYKRGIKPLRCGRFYIYPPWEKPQGNLVLGMQFRTCENFRTSTDSSLVESPKIFTNTKATPQSLPLRFCESQNLGENSPIYCHSERSEESQKKNNRDSSPLAQNDNLRKFAESTLDSTDSTTNAESANKSQQTIEGIAVEVVGFLGDFGCETGYKSAKHSKSPKSPQDAPKSKLQNTINILLEPSLAFGTGHHASTFMCIEAIQSLDAQDSLKNKKLLDFGCGSGILALCASKLGAVVDLCDIDELALTESKKNFNNNNATISHIWQGGIALNTKYDIITANIIASVLIEQKDSIDSALGRGGVAILSGILDIYKDEVLARFSDFTPLEIKQKDEWICATLQKL